MYNKTIVYTNSRTVIREVNILFFYSRYASDKVSTLFQWAYITTNSASCDVKEKTKSCGSKVLVCPILLCLAGYEWIKDMLKKNKKSPA